MDLPSTEGFPDAAWRKSSYSVRTLCVEVAQGSHQAAIRDSQAPDNAVLVLGRARFQSFIRAIKAGRLD
jgi:Domain of unknown function (DUF397)